MYKEVIQHGSQYSVRTGTEILSTHDSYVDAIRAAKGMSNAKEEKEVNREEKRNKEDRRDGDKDSSSKRGRAKNKRSSGRSDSAEGEQTKASKDDSTVDEQSRVPRVAEEPIEKDADS